MVANSRMMLFAPISSFVGSPAYFRSCGGEPMLVPVEHKRDARGHQELEDVGIDGAQGVLINISATEESLTMTEFMEACRARESRP